MRVTVLALVAVALVAQAPSPSLAHPEREAVQQELLENCVACCLATRRSLRGRLQLNPETCATACSSWAADLIRRFD